MRRSTTDPVVGTEPAPVGGAEAVVDATGAVTVDGAAAAVSGTETATVDAARADLAASTEVSGSDADAIGVAGVDEDSAGATVDSAGVDVDSAGVDVDTDDGDALPREVVGGGVAHRAFGRLLPLLLVIGGGVGWVAAFVLTLEKMALLRDPSYQPSCSINPVLSCGSVMAQPQAEAFGFPNPLLGVTGFAVVVTVSAVLLAGARPRRWFWLGLQAGVTFGVVFVHWLIFQSLFRIGALCPYCMVVWAVTIPIFWYLTLHNLDRGVIPVPARARGAVAGLVDFHSIVPIGWFVMVVAVIGVRFWSYWSTLL